MERQTRISRAAILLVTLNLISCSRQDFIIKSTDPDISRFGEFVLYRGEKLTGTIETAFTEVDVMRRTPYSGGLTEGLEVETYGNGQKAAERDYLRGRRIGVHRGWFANGIRRFQYEYREGELNGESWEWYPSGALYTYGRYDMGRAIGRKVWRENGQIYTNAVYFQNQQYGLPGARLCRQVRTNDSGKTVNF